MQRVVVRILKHCSYTFVRPYGNDLIRLPSSLLMALTIRHRKGGSSNSYDCISLLTFTVNQYDETGIFVYRILYSIVSNIAEPIDCLINTTTITTC